MQAVSAALDLLFADPNLALDAWHRDVAGQFTKLRIIPRRADSVTEFGAARLCSRRWAWPPPPYPAGGKAGHPGYTSSVGATSWGSPRLKSSRLRKHRARNTPNRQTDPRRWTA